MNEIIDALPGLGAVGLATGLIAAHRLIFGDPDANQHHVNDYKPTADLDQDNDPSPSCTHEWHGADGGRCPDCGWDAAPIPAEPTQLRRDWNGLDWNKADFDWGYTDDILPPAPPGTNAGGSPLYSALLAEQVIAEQLREQYGTTNPDAIAGTILRQLAAEQVTR